MRSLVISCALLFSGVAFADDKECKTSDDCAMLGPACCDTTCSAVPKKQLKRAKKALDDRCKAAGCAEAKGPSETCSAPLVCIQYKCELGHVKAWDADKKKDAAKKAAEKKDE